MLGTYSCLATFSNIVSTQQESKCKSLSPSVRNTFGVSGLCNLLLLQFSFLYIQTLLNDCLYIKDVHLLFCAHLINIFLFLWVLNLDIFPSEMHRGCLVCVICNSNSFHFFLFNLCIMIVHTLKMCTSYFVNISCFFSFLGS